ncbi:MAG: hypothetical protein JKX71_03975 [Amylibacter sp.]|nr:hypothetical protein [Amylibacter sp.]
MRNETLLEGIWQGDVVSSQSRMSKEIQHLLKLMLPLHTVCLSANSAVTCSRIIPEEIELLPALSLGDILAEELSTIVPPGSMIVVLKDHDCKAVMSKQDISFQLGLIIGDVLLGIVGDGVFPLQYETEALRVMANSYCSLAESLERKQKTICSTRFQNGLSKSVSEYWNGPAQSTRKTTLKSSNEMVLFCRYLKATSPYIWSRKANQKHVNLSKIYSKSRNCHTWKVDIVEAVLGEILSDTGQVYNH